MSETFFHLLGPGTQPNDDSFSMNPLPITCQVNDEPSMAALEQCAHSPQVIALLNELQHQLSERQPPLGEVLAVDLLNLNTDDRHFINTLLGEGEVSVRIQQADDSEVKYRRRSSADYGGCADVAATSCWRTNWRLAARRWHCGRRQRKTSCRQIRCYRRPLMA